MSLTTAFISELVWAANQVEHLTSFEERRLLERAVVMIREMRGQSGNPQNENDPDPVTDLQTVVAEIERQTGEQVRAALLGAADMIRTSRILLDSKT